MPSPAILTVAPNGARRNKADHPGLPTTPVEITAEAARCRNAGAAMLHLHVRDAAGRHTLDPGRYSDAIAAVNEAAPDIVIQITTEGAGRFGPAEQAAALMAVQPEAASLANREIGVDERVAAKTFAWAAEADIARVSSCRS